MARPTFAGGFVWLTFPVAGVDLSDFFVTCMKVSRKTFIIARFRPLAPAQHSIFHLFSGTFRPFHGFVRGRVALPLHAACAKNVANHRHFDVA